MELYNNELYHHGVKGMKWGVRKARENVGVSSNTAKSKRSEADNNSKKSKLSERQKTALKVGAVATGTALAAYGTYKLSKLAKEKAYIKNYDRACRAVEKLLNDPSSGHIKASAGLYNKRDKWVQETLIEDAIRYAKRNSSTTKDAVKTLLGKNRQFTTAELLNMGLNVSFPDFTPPPSLRK